MTEKKHYALIKQIEDWVEEGRYQDILDTLLALPQAELDTELTGILARTYNSLGHYEQAIPLLRSIESKCQDDPNWYYRMGNSYYYTQRSAEAEQFFARAAALDPDDADTKEFLYRCRPNFRQRVEQFWQWFTTHADEISDKINRHRETAAGEIIELIRQGTRIIHPNLPFNLEGDHEFTFSVEGRDYLFYLYPYLIAHMPEPLKKSWNFHPWNPGLEGKDMGFAIFGKSFNFADIMVSAYFNNEREEFNLHFYSEELKGLDDTSIYHAFFTMLDLCLGEGMSYLYINDVEFVNEVKEDMMPLTELRDFIQVTVIESGKALKQTPNDLYDCYRKEPEESACFRDDVMAGVTRYRSLVTSYYRGDRTRFNTLLEYGAKAAFLAFPYDIKKERRTILNVRYELQDRIERLLNPNDPTRPHGLMLEGASGDECMYIDLLLYDEINFLKRVKDILKDYPYNFFYCDYRYGAWYTLLQEYDRDPKYNRYFKQCILRNDI